MYYVTDYITKASLPAHIGLGALSYAIKRTNERFPHMTKLQDERVSRSALVTTVNRMVSRQEISHQQVMSYLVGGGDVYTSHSYRILHWGSFDRLFKRFFKETLHKPNVSGQLCADIDEDRIESSDRCDDDNLEQNEAGTGQYEYDEDDGEIVDDDVECSGDGAEQSSDEDEDVFI